MRASAQTRVELFSSGGAFPSSPSDLLKAKQPRSNLVEPQPSWTSKTTVLGDQYDEI